MHARVLRLSCGDGPSLRSVRAPEPDGAAGCGVREPTRTGDDRSATERAPYAGRGEVKVRKFL